MTVALSSSSLITQSGTDTSLAVLDTIFANAAVVARTVAYSVNNIIKPVTATGMLYTCSVAGTTTAVEPAYGTTVGSVTVDGTASFVAFAPPSKAVVGNKTIYTLSVLRLAINGAFTWDAKLENLQMVAATASPVCVVNSGGVLTTNSVINGIPTYEDALVIRAATSGVQTEFRVNTGGTFVWNGARISVSGIGSNNYQTIFFDKGATITVTKGWLKSAGNQTRWGEAGSGNMLAMNINGLTVENIFTTIFGAFGSLSGLAPLNSVTQTVSYGSFPSLVLRDYAPLDTGSFLDNYDIVNLYAINSLGSGLDIRSGQGPGKWISLQKEFTLSTLTAEGAVINGAVAYVKDMNNGGRVDIPAIPNQLNNNVYINSTSGAGITPTVLLHVLHAQAQAAYQSIPVRDYRTKTTTPGADLFDVSILAYGYNYALLNDVAMKGTGVLALSRTLLADAGVTLTEANAVAKLASSFTVAGNTLTATAASTLDDLYDAMKAYKTRPVQAQLEYPTISTQPVTASGKTLVTAMTLVINAALTAGSKFDKITVSATLSGTLAAGGVYTFTGGTLAAPVSAPSLTGGTINIGAAATYGFTTSVGTTIVSMTPTAPSTYPLNGPHAATLDLRNTSAFAITVQLPTGTAFTTAANIGGAITVVNPPITLQILRPNIINGSNFVIRNVTQSIEVAAGTCSGGTGINVTLTSGTHYATGNTLEILIGYCVGTSARLPITEQVTAPAATAVNSAPTTQTQHTVYNSIAINGSTVTGFTADYAGFDVNVTLGADFLGQNFMAWWVYNESTLNGLRNFTELFTLLDEANMRNNAGIALVLLDNTTINDIKQIDNIRIFCSDGTYPVKQPSTGGGSIDVNWRNPVLVTGLGAVAQDVRIEMDANSTKLTSINNKTTNLPALPASTTNITAGTITTVANVTSVGTVATVTNLTNAPTNGDLTATMKASITAAVPTASAIRTEIDANSTKLDVAVSTRESTVNANANAAAIPAAVFAGISEAGQSYGKQIRDIRAAVLGVSTGGGTTTETFKGADNATVRVTSVNNGTDRTSVTLPGA